MSIDWREKEKEKAKIDDSGGQILLVLDSCYFTL
jgi:hypothetical protein